MAAAGRVITGFSLPYVAEYSANGTTVTYSNGMQLARGVEVSVELEDAGEDNIFYADNVAAESISGIFTGGDLTLTVDGLTDAARKLILGLPAAGTDDWIPYDDTAAAPYVGVGFIIRYMAEGATSYVPVVIRKCKFKNNGIAAKTQEDAIDFQTEELTAKIVRSDDTNHSWQFVGEEQTTEALAEGMIKALFSIT